MADYGGILLSPRFVEASIRFPIPMGCPPLNYLNLSLPLSLRLSLSICKTEISNNRAPLIEFYVEAISFLVKKAPYKRMFFSFF